jgi:hypothetical protein
MDTPIAYAFPEKCLNPSSGLVHNFAFGSNLSAEKMQSRGITVLRARPAILRGYQLRFSQLGFPPAEPSFATLEPCTGAEVHGICFDLEPQQFGILWHGEGGGAWYSEELVTLSCYDGDCVEGVVAFMCLPERRVPGGGELPPSARYLSLLTTGAAEVGLDSAYQAMLKAQPSTPTPNAAASYLLHHRLAFHLKMSKVVSSYPENTQPLPLRLFEVLRAKYLIFGQTVGVRLVGSRFDWLTYLVYVPEAALGLSMQFMQASLGFMPGFIMRRLCAF